MAKIDLLAALRKKRERSVDLGEGLAVTFLRPREGEVSELLQGAGDARVISVQISQVRRYVNGWSGFSEATFLGAAVGSSDPLPFDAELWAEAVTDRVDWVNKISGAILQSIVEHLEQKAAAEKN